MEKAREYTVVRIKEFIGRIIYGRLYGHSNYNCGRSNGLKTFLDITSQLKLQKIWPVDIDKAFVEIVDAKRNTLGDVSFDDEGNLVLTNFSTGENTVQLATLVDLFVEAQEILVEWYEDEPPLPKGKLIKIHSK